MKTIETIRDLEILANCGLRISGDTQGRANVPWATVMSSLVFGRIVLNVINVLRLTPGSNFCQPVGAHQIWDLSAVASLSRNLVEACLVLHYMAAQMPDEEAKLRELVWRNHEVSERYKMLQDGLPQSPGIPVLKQRVATLRTAIESAPAFLALSKQLQTRIVNGKMAKLLTNEEICRAAGVDIGYYNTIFKYGSNHTHSSPFCFAEMDKFNANEEEQREETVLWMALQASAGFLSRAILDFVNHFPDQDKGISPEERFRLTFWDQILKQRPASLVPKNEK